MGTPIVQRACESSQATCARNDMHVTYNHYYLAYLPEMDRATGDYYPTILAELESVPTGISSTRL